MLSFATLSLLQHRVYFHKPKDTYICSACIFYLYSGEIVVAFCFADLSMTVSLIDPTVDETKKLKCVFFARQLDMVPKIRAVGDIIRIHRLLVNEGFILYCYNIIDSNPTREHCDDNSSW